METQEEKTLKDFADMFTPADLHPELARYLTVGEPFDKLQHPLVFGVPYTSQMNNHYNRQLALFKEEVARALNENNAFRYVFRHERPYRLEAFNTFLSRKEIPDETYWELLGSIWIDSENIWQYKEVWLRLLSSPRPHKYSFMEVEERRALRDLPSRLKVYRGCIKGFNEDGMSWTLDKKKATWFSQRYRRETETPMVRERTVSKKDVFAYLTSRSEQEIILL